ncbi:MAG TPA: ATP-binding protein [Smithellaceae bacterium]|nr:ATP-binding protein [Smithellaceae bacterium]
MRIKKMPAELSNLHELLAFITGMAGEAGLTTDALNRLELVAEEALVNIIKHAYPSSPGDVEVRLSAGVGPSLIAEIRDAGVAFDPLQKPDPDISAGLDERKVGGLGVFMMHKMADRLAYRRDQNQNVLTLTFLNR